MRINAVEITEFPYVIEDYGTRRGNWVYDPGETLELPGFALVIRTADGAVGHYRGFMFASVALPQIEMVADEFLLGRDPLEREGIWQDLWRSLRHTDHIGVGPIDIALWDLAGRQYDESVSSLLGGYRDSVPVYASAPFVDDAPDGLNGPDAFTAYAEQCRRDGYGGFKMHAHPDGRPDIDLDICRALAEAVGDDMDLMLDVGSLYRTYAETLRVGQALDDLDFFWYEDPMMDTGQSLRMIRRLVRELDTPMLGLEHVRTGPFGSVDHLADEGLDLVRVNAHLDGGITGVMKTARAAEAFGMDIEPHLGGPAHLHVMSAVRNTNYFEHGLTHPRAGWMNHQGFVDPVEVLNDEGMIDVPEGPGLGVALDWDLIEDRTTDRTIIE